MALNPLSHLSSSFTTSLSLPLLGSFLFFASRSSTTYISSSISPSHLAIGRNEMGTFTKRKTPSSTRWMARQLSDPFVKKAHNEGMVSRAAYKLEQINEKYKFLSPGKVVIDLGAAPGGWSQIASQRVHTTSPSKPGVVVAIDKLPLERVFPGVISLTFDFMDDRLRPCILEHLPKGKADVVLCDMAPSYTGDSGTNHSRLMELAETALTFAESTLVPQRGVFLCKLSRGGSEKQFFTKLQSLFSNVKYVKPDASRSDSSEIYCIAIGFRPPSSSSFSQPRTAPVNEP